MAPAVRAAIAGMGAAVPDRVITNQDLEKFLDTSDEWITQRTGIKQRHVVSDGQTTATLAAQAGRAALHQAGVKPTELDMIICATITPDMTCPATALSATPIRISLPKTSKRPPRRSGTGSMPTTWARWS